MPERVTVEERKISMAIEKARNAKEILYQSLMDNNRSELKDESEAVKVTRPKAENVNLEMKPQGTHSGFGLGSHATAGDSLKKSSLNQGQPPNSWEQVVQMAEEAIKNSGNEDMGAMKALRRLAELKDIAKKEFSIQSLEEAMKEAANYDAMLRFINVKPKF